MELSWRLFGWQRVRLTSGDCAARLRQISEGMRIENIVFEGELTVLFDAARSDIKKIRLGSGERLEVVASGGVPRLFGWLACWRIAAAFGAILLVLTVFLPTRLWFFRVEGNADVPARLILEQAEAAGVRFGASRRELRSEQVKNHLLWAIPELRWAGVNTQGCTATITVAVRDPEDMPEDTGPGDIVAVTDAVVTGVVTGTGTALVVPGEVVTGGEILISGMTDLGLCTRVDRAEGEVYGLTRRHVTVTMPQIRTERADDGRTLRKFSLRIGKKAVNFSNDSGILHGSCVKMRTVNYLMLPGGFSLPVALVTDTYSLADTAQIRRAEEEEELLEAARRYVREQMTAGVIVSEETEFDGHTLSVTFGCRELIGVFRPGSYLERDTNERENGERGAG